MQEDINRRSPEFYYAQLAQIMAGLIRAGDPEPGELLRPEPWYMQRYGVSRGTVRKALEMLAADGYIERIRGRGNLVLPPGHWPQD